jgi:hypothetical protein
MNFDVWIFDYMGREKSRHHRLDYVACHDFCSYLLWSGASASDNLQMQLRYELHISESDSV